jgi:hypothetical protein
MLVVPSPCPCTFGAAVLSLRNRLCDIPTMPSKLRLPTLVRNRRLLPLVGFRGRWRAKSKPRGRRGICAKGGEEVAILTEHGPHYVYARVLDLGVGILDPQAFQVW